MTGLGDRVAALLEQPVRLDGGGEPVVEVPTQTWPAAVAAVRDDPATELTMFDLLTAVDELPGGFAVVVRLWSPRHRHGLQLRTRCSREDPRVPSLTALFAGAGWHERATWEMFGIGFDGHTDLRPLLLPDGFAGHPLRKDFVLASRVAKPWPGAPEPGQSTAQAADAPARRRSLPPGMPPSGTWPST